MERSCKHCGSSLDGQRRNAKQCPECRLLTILRWCMERKRVRSCKSCGNKYRSAGEYDLAYCASCAETSTSPALRSIFRGRVTRCDLCEENEDRWWEVADPAADARREQLGRTIEKCRTWMAKGLNVEANQRQIDELMAKLDALDTVPQEHDHLALDHRVPLCAHCAKDPERQAKAVQWLEKRQAQRIRDKALARA